MPNLPSILSPDFGLLFWMLVAFVIVFTLLAKFGFPVIIKMVEDRKSYIDESLKNAREANEKLANIKSESAAILKEAREHQAQIIKEAMATRDSIIKEAKDKAQAEGLKLLNEAKAQILQKKKTPYAISATRLPTYRLKLQEKLCGSNLRKIPSKKNISNDYSTKWLNHNPSNSLDYEYRYYLNALCQSVTQIFRRKQRGKSGLCRDGHTF